MLLLFQQFLHVLLLFSTFYVARIDLKEPEKGDSCGSMPPDADPLHLGALSRAARGTHCRETFTPASTGHPAHSCSYTVESDEPSHFGINVSAPAVCAIELFFGSPGVIPSLANNLPLHINLYACALVHSAVENLAVTHLTNIKVFGSTVFIIRHPAHANVTLESCYLG